MAVITEPRLLLLDEPCAGLSHEETARVIDAIQWVRQYLNLRIIVIEHDMELVWRLAERVVVLHQGRFLADGSVEEVQGNPDVACRLRRRVPMSASMLFEIDRVSGGYGSGLVVRDVSLSVARGEAVCLLGRNGVGKSTLVKLACGFLRPESGEVRLAGAKITGQQPSDNRVAGLTYCPQERVVFDDLTVAENLTLMRRNRRLEDFESYFRGVSVAIGAKAPTCRDAVGRREKAAILCSRSGRANLRWS